MRKIIIAIALSAMVASLSQANVYVSWGANDGFFEMGGGPNPIFTVGSGDSILAQLIWSPTNTADAAMFGAPNYVSGDDVWLVDYVVTEGSTATSEWGTFAAGTFNDGGALPNNGFVYARVFENAAPQVGDWYYVGPIVSAVNWDPLKPQPDPPQLYPVNHNGLGDADDYRIDGMYGAQVVAVPEPGTIMLFALGVATLAASRRRRKAVEA